MSLAVLLYDVADVVRFTSLLKFSSRNKIFNFSDGSNCILVGFRQSARRTELRHIDQTVPVCITKPVAPLIRKLKLDIMNLKTPHFIINKMLFILNNRGRHTF